jgi:hypothetical protein
MSSPSSAVDAAAFAELIALLRADLEAGLALYRRGDIAGRRLGAARQLAVVVRLIGCITDAVDPRLIAPLQDLAMALTDLDKGVRDELLQPIKLGHHGPIPTRRQGFRLRAVVVMELLMGSGEKKSAAANTVARRLAAVSPEKKPLTGTMIENWREQVMAAPSQSLPAERYRWMLQELALRFPNDPKGAAEALLCQMVAAKPTK